MKTTRKLIITIAILLSTAVTSQLQVKAASELAMGNLQQLRKEWGPFVGPWKRYEKNPIIKLEGKESYSIQNGPQSVIRWKDKWYMFLMTSQPMMTKLALSDDGLIWNRQHHDYLLKPEMPWEGHYNLAKAAVVRDDEVWLYYFGKKDHSEMIGLARSKDLINWKKEPKPIFTHKDSRLDGERAFPDCVIKEGDTWYMYYDVGYDYHHPKNPDGYAIGVATSKDGVSWTDSPKSPMLTTSERTATSWDDGMVSQCSVTKVGDWFYMLYSGSTNNHGRKHSGKNRMAFGLVRAKHPEGPWEKYPHNPVFKPTGNANDFDGIFLQHACPIKVGNQWRLYYNGWTKVPKSKERPVGAEYAIGLAFANPEMENGFKSPPNSARPMTWWHWVNGNISKEEITRDLEVMKSVGIGGVQLFDVGDVGIGIPRGPVDYASDAWYEMVAHARMEAERLELDMSMHNGGGWSNTGGPWVKPEQSMKTVVWTEQQVKGSGLQILTLKQPETKSNFYRDIAVLAFPTPEDELSGPVPVPLAVKPYRGPEDNNVSGGPFRLKWWSAKSGASGGNHYRIPRDSREAPDGSVIPVGKVVDLTAMKDPNGEGYLWKVPSGNWTVVRFGYTTTGQRNRAATPAGEGLETDKLDKGAVDFHWNHLIQRMVDESGDSLGRSFTSILVDSYEVQHQNWTATFPSEFEQHCGYSLTRWMPCLTGRVVGNVEQSERFLWNFRKTQSAMQADNYFGRFAELCHQNKMKLYIEPYGSGMFDSFEVARIADVPMGEFWLDRTQLHWTSKLAASAAHIDGEKTIAAESFTSDGKSS